MTLYLYNYIIIYNLYLYNYSDSVLTTRHRCISYFPRSSCPRDEWLKKVINSILIGMKLRVDISHLQCMSTPS